MNLRVFRISAVVVLVAILASIGLGAWSFFLERDSPAKNDVFIIHFGAGLITALAILLVHCAVFTYFLGTGRWVKEVGLAYHLPDQDLPRTTRELKRQVFPPALFAMLSAIAAAAAGAGAQLQEWPWQIHATLALVTLGINLWAFRVEVRTIETNGAVVKAVMAEVERILEASGQGDHAQALERDA
ncbi:MAG: hypothetical protein HY040_12925 [Planctomycetes bacterium]|nr:hypothetical protein [Planctomycetota bacterium]